MNENYEKNKKLPPCDFREVSDRLRCSYKWYGSCGYEFGNVCYICFFSDIRDTWREQKSLCVLGKPRCIGSGVQDFLKNTCFVPACGKPKIPTDIMMLIIERKREAENKP